MGIFAWILIGLIAGIIARTAVGHSMGWILTIFLGILGAIVGGWLTSLFGGPGVTGLNLVSILVAALGAIVLLLVYRLVSRPGR